MAEHMLGGPATLVALDYLLHVLGANVGATQRISYVIVRLWDVAGCETDVVVHLQHPSGCPMVACCVLFLMRGHVPRPGCRTALVCLCPCSLV